MARLNLQRQTFVLLVISVCSSALCDEIAPKGEEPKYTGAGSCSSSSCHGGVQPRSSTSVLQNEYSTWAVQDKHAHAYRVLSDDVAQRMGRILGLEPAKSSRCLACHALDVPEALRSRSFDLTDGVTCENCHGPASNWLGPHTRRDWNYDKSLAAGLYDTRNLIKRSERCLSCHLGDGSRSVTHELIAAGHPDLYFELDSFSAVEPRHWKESAANDPGIGVRTLAVGEAVQLRENMRRVARDAAKGWPEFSDLECFSCHHNLTDTGNSWRQQRGYAGRKPGSPPWNASRFSVLRVIASELDGGDAQLLSSDVARVNTLVSDVQSDRAQVASAANAAAEAADRVAHRIQTSPISQSASLQLMKAISSDADRISAQGERAAEQAAMALDSLYLAYTKNSAGNPPLKGAIAALFPLLENPSSYQPGPFARQMRNVRSVLAE